MDYYDYYLRGPDRDAVRASLLQAGLTVEYEVEGEMHRMPAEGVNLSTVGTMYQGGEWNADGDVITPPAALPGWHVNLRLDCPLSVEEEAVLGEMLVAPDPVTPYRVWA